MELRYVMAAAGVLACGLVVLIPSLTPAARAAEPAKPTQPGISAEANAAIQQMGKTLSANEFSVQARTIRVRQDDDGQPLHIFHTMKVIAHRPDRLSIHVTGDDGGERLVLRRQDGRHLRAKENKYARIAAPNNIEAMLDAVTERLHVDFPLADFLDADPGKSFLSGVTSGREVDTVTIDGNPSRHLFFSQAGGIELEAWLDKTEQAVPRRLIVTYRLLPGQPNFIAEFSDWNFSAHPSDTEFVFQPPAGAKEVALAPEKGGNK